MLENQERFHSPSSADGSSTLAEGFIYLFIYFLFFQPRAMNVRMCSIVSKHAAFICICVVFGSAGPLPGGSRRQSAVVVFVLLASFFKRSSSWSSVYISGFLLRLRRV